MLTNRAPIGDILEDEVYQSMASQLARRYKQHDRTSTQLILQLVYTFSLCETRLQANIQKKGLTLPGLNVLCLLRYFGKHGCPLHELSRLLVVSRANVTGLLDSLVRRGYAERVDHPSDRRIILARITSAGETWLDHYLPAHYAEIQAMTSGLASSEKSTLIQLLAKLRKSIGRSKRIPGHPHG